MKQRSGLIAALALAIALAALAAFACSCSKSKGLPEDPNLELYIDVTARCAYADRAFSNDPELFREEIAEVNLPEDWKEISDSLLAAYGADVEFWYQVYTRILERSRK
jgi:hypothetical protein